MIFRLHLVIINARNGIGENEYLHLSDSSLQVGCGRQLGSVIHIGPLQRGHQSYSVTSRDIESVKSASQSDYFPTNENQELQVKIDIVLVQLGRHPHIRHLSTLHFYCYNGGL